jgi:hypothetical protein
MRHKTIAKSCVWYIGADFIAKPVHSQARGAMYVSILQSSFVRAFQNLVGVRTCMIANGVPAGLALAIGDVERNIRTGNFEVVHVHQRSIVIIISVQVAGPELMRHGIPGERTSSHSAESLPSLRSELWQCEIGAGNFSK